MTPDNFYFQYTLDPSADEPIMFIDRHIGFDEEDGYGIMGDYFQKELLVLDTMDKKRIQVWINSVGGIVLDGMAIYNGILKTKTKVDTYCFGMAASIAGVIFQAGRNRIMADYGILMYHNPFGSDDSDGLAAMKESICKMIASRCGMEEDAVGKIMDRDTYLSAEEALELKLCDRIEVSTDYNKKRLSGSQAKGDHKLYWREAGIITNKILDTKIVRKMKKVANRLKLNEDATEDSILSEIDRIENRAKAAEDEIANKKTELQTKEDALKKKGEEFDALKAELDKLKKDAKDKEDADKAKAELESENKAKDEVMNYVKLGKIKNEAAAIDKWTKIAKENPGELKELFGALPINKAANKIEVGEENRDKKPGSVIAATMVQNKAKMLAEKAGL